MVAPRRDRRVKEAKGLKRRWAGMKRWGVDKKEKTNGRLRGKVDMWAGVDWGRSRYDHAFLSFLNIQL